MILYASQTHGSRNLKALRENGFRLLATPDTWRGRPPLWEDKTPAAYALDNGAYGCFKRGAPFNWAAFNELAENLGSGADWIIAPDIVEGGIESLEMSLSWLSGWDRCPVLIAVQDGIKPRDVAPHLSERVGVAIGGSTAYKENSLIGWGKLSATAGCYLHVLRVNTRRRLTLCRSARADSIDGTSASIFSKTAPLLKGWADTLDKQQTLGIW